MEIIEEKVSDLNIDTWKSDPRAFFCERNRCWMLKTACLAMQKPVMSVHFGALTYTPVLLKREKCRGCEVGLKHKQEYETAGKQEKKLDKSKPTI